MLKLKTIFQPISFSKLFDSEINELLDERWGIRDGYPIVVSHEAKEDTLVAILDRYEE